MITLATALAWSASTPAFAGFMTGLGGHEYTSADSAERDRWFDATVDAGAAVVRINVSWRGLVSQPPVDPANPADPAYDFGRLDGAVRAAASRDLDVLLTLYHAPDFAEGEGREAGATPGTWRPDPGDYGAFARAVATRYSGSYLDLPRVRYYQAWNEPNLNGYLTPQWQGGVPVAASHYRTMLNAFEASVHAIRPENVVVTAGTAPFGDPSGGSRIRPLRFWREVLCLRKKNGKLVGTRCEERARFDILAHHPIQTAGGPRRSALHPDDATTPDFKYVVQTLRRAEKLNKVTGRPHPLWATEIWWQSNPPDHRDGVPLKRHAAWNEESLYLLWKQGAQAVINLLIRDMETTESSIEAGLYFHDGSPKPALTAWRFPFVVDARSDRGATAWGVAPASGRLTIQRSRGASWKSVGRVQATSRQVFTKRIQAASGQRFRAVVAGDKSLAWRLP